MLSKRVWSKKKQRKAVSLDQVEMMMKKVAKDMGTVVMLERVLMTKESGETCTIDHRLCHSSDRLNRQGIPAMRLNVT